VGGPPLVSAIRVKVGGVARNEDDKIDAFVILTSPYPVEKRMSITHTHMYI